MRQEHDYADVEIRILDQQEAGYPVEITLNREQEFPRGYLCPDALPWVSSASPAQDGERLFEWLFADDRIKTAWAEVRGQQPRRRIRLRIDSAAPELHAIPWELLRDPGDGSAPQDLAALEATPFSRYLAGKWQPGAPILQRPIRMLAVIANPANLAEYDLAAVDVAAEWAVLKELTAELDLELVQLPEPCTLSALESELKKGYHALHFVGHGRYSQKLGVTALYLADEGNRVALVRDVDLAAMLARQLADADVGRENKLRLVFLASCQTATRSPADAYRGLAPQLVVAGVPAVLAMQDLVPVATARQFSRVFYAQLLEHGRVDLASNEARSALLTGDLPGAAIPVLFMRLRNGRLLGQRGLILTEGGEVFWNTLLKNIYDGECTPILGPGITADLLPHLDQVAETLADEHGYPLADCRDFPRVAQFVATVDDVRLRKDVIRILRDGFKGRMGLKDEPTSLGTAQADAGGGRGVRARQPSPQTKGLVETIEASHWSARSQEILESEAHHQLAELPLPLYLTTNFDNFMTLALRAQGCQARRAAITWNQPSPSEAGEQFPELDPLPGLDQPVVIHLFGTEDDPASMVLTQDNYLDYLARISRDHEHLLPPSVQRALAQNTLLFIGYRLEDLDLKVIMRGLLTQLDLKRWPRLRVAVQIEARPDTQDKKGQIIQYFQKYFAQAQEAQIDVYWGDARQFVADLYARWQAFLEERHDGA